MSNKQKPSKSRRSAGLAIAVCFSAAIIMAGTYALKGMKESKEQELSMLEEEQESRITKAEELVINTEETEETKADSEEDSLADGVEGNDADENDAEGNGVSKEDADLLYEESNASKAAQTAGTNISVNFTENSRMLWPVDGNLLMGYSMDQTVYFSTLDQYKYNPAMIIAGVEGDQVIAGAAGVVKSIDNTARTGLTVNIDLGNGYEVFYGQLKDIPLKVGDYVTANTVVGYVAQPTKYYVAEGCNVYFEMRKDGQAVDPLEYIEQ